MGQGNLSDSHAEMSGQRWEGRNAQGQSSREKAKELFYSAAALELLLAGK